MSNNEAHSCYSTDSLHLPLSLNVTLLLPFFSASSPAFQICCVGLSWNTHIKLPLYSAQLNNFICQRLATLRWNQKHGTAKWELRMGNRELGIGNWGLEMNSFAVRIWSANELNMKNSQIDFHLFNRSRKQQEQQQQQYRTTWRNGNEYQCADDEEARTFCNLPFMAI